MKHTDVHFDVVDIDYHVTVIFKNGRELIGGAVVKRTVLNDGRVGFLGMVVDIGLNGHHLGIGTFNAVQKNVILCVHLHDKQDSGNENKKFFHRP